MCSDHLPITTVISVESICSVVRRVRDWKRVDWKAFNATLLWRLGLLPEFELQSEKDVDTVVAYLTKGLQYATDECVPIKRLCSYSRTGWTPEVKALHRTMIDRRRRWVRFRKVADRERYLQSRSRFRQCLKKNRQFAWQELCSSTTSADYWSLYKKVNRTPGSHRVEELTHDGLTASTDSEKATMLAKVFFPPLPLAGPESEVEEPDFSWRTHRPPGLPETELVTPMELIRVIRRLRVAAAPSIDGITVLCLKKCMLVILPWLLRIYNASIAHAYFPREWRRGKVIALRKPGKPSYESPQSYRPISLLSNMGKIMEMLMNRRLMRRLEQEHILAASQFGFRSGHEVVDTCSRLAEDIVAAFCHGEVVQAVTLDIQPAYNTVWRKGFVQKLEVIGMEPYIIAWLYSFLSDRCCSLEVGGSTLEMAPKCGLSQGSPLFPTLFLVYIDDLLHPI